LVLITRRKGFQKLFENAFEILEKEKEIEILFLLSFWPEGLLLPSSASRPFSVSPASQQAQLLFLVAPGLRVRVVFLLLVSLPHRACV
jgi:hypothetical protein